MRIYISGKITGLDPEEARANFKQVEHKLREIGYTNIFNPIENVPQHLPYEKQMKICLAALTNCNCIMLMPNWEQSLGSRRELTQAMKQDLHIRYTTAADYKQLQQYLKYGNATVRETVDNVKAVLMKS